MSNDKTERPDFITGRMQRRRAKIAAEIRRNREGGHRVPTWLLAVLLVVVLAAWAWLIFSA
ncbi:hypothetical protein [Longispora albida]|uniref:hypothetical protein n=1 Tax=Longispora albida TaxID=203523 RepID=UPI0003804E70|nr:hypothetical protein [Longispora albida]